MVKVLGRKIKDFYEDSEFDFLDEHDNMQIDLDIEDLEDDVFYETSKLGDFLDTRNDKNISFTKAFKEWETQQEYDYLLIKIKKDDFKNIVEKLKEMGVKI